MKSKPIILITGSSSGIGLCAAQTLHKRGYRVFAAVRKPEDKIRLEQMGLTGLLLDVNDSASIRRGVDAVLAQTDGKLDALFNNAGFGIMGAVEDLSRENFRAQFETNVFGLQELTNYVLPVMRRQGHGRIVNVSSMLGIVSMAYRGLYSASKFALEALSDALRLELEGTNIYVSLIEPGPIESEFRHTAKSIFKQQMGEEKIKQSAHRNAYQNLQNRADGGPKKPPFMLAPDAVINKLIDALESSRPKPRYYVTKPTYFLAVLKRVLSSRWMDKVMGRLMKGEK